MNLKALDIKQTLLSCYAGWVASAAAIVVDDYTAAETAPSNVGTNYALNWDYVYSYNGATAVAVDDDWIVTAKHVGLAASFSVDGVSYTSLQHELHPTADLALIRVDKALPGYYDLYTGVFTNAPSVLMVGYGTIGTVSTFSWMAENAGGGVKRWGTQQIEGSNPATKTFSMKFNGNDTDYEAGAGYGDSGSGVFCKTNDIWYLAGINTDIFWNGSTGFDRMEGVAMPAVADWIETTMNIPEPAAIGLMGFGTIGLFLARSRRRRRVAGSSVFPIRGDEPLCDRFDDSEVEGEAGHGAGRVWAESFVSGLKRFSLNPPVTWLSAVQARCKALNEAFLSLFMALSDRVAAAKDLSKPVKSALARRTDAFLERVSWDRIVSSVDSARTGSIRALKKGICRSLDAFLELMRWDQIEAAFRRFKKRIRFSRHD